MNTMLSLFTQTGLFNTSEVTKYTFRHINGLFEEKRGSIEFAHNDEEVFRYQFIDNPILFKCMIFNFATSI